MNPLHIETPLFESRALSAVSGRSIWLKMESAQPPGSFKIRGIGHACQQYAQQGAKRFISSSGGNAGIAVAYAGRQLSIPVVVVVPETTTERAKSLIQQEGAEVIVHGSVFDEANAMAQSMITETDAFLHPFDDPFVWEGHSSMIDEVTRAGVRPDAVVLSVGGGGLMSGVIAGLHRNDWSGIPVIAVETEGAASLARSVSSGERIELPKIESIATSLAARQVCQQAYDWTTRHPVRNVVLSDKSAVAACNAFLADHRTVVEPACGAALAAIYDSAPEIEEYATVLAVVCGGAVASLEQLEAWTNEIA